MLLIHWQELESQRRPITDFSTWAQCFAIYSAAVLQKQPHRAADLMAYLIQTVNNAKKFKWPAWLVYDQNFRQLMADKQDLVWSKPDPGIFAQCFLNMGKSAEAWCKQCHSVEHTSASCPLAPPHNNRSSMARTAEGPDKLSATICRNYNSKEKGCKWRSNCYRRHLCSECSGPHPKFKCPSKPEGSQ